jgi:hypothetical protein
MFYGFDTHYEETFFFGTKTFDLDLELWPSFEKHLTCAISFEPNVLRL